MVALAALTLVTALWASAPVMGQDVPVNEQSKGVATDRDDGGRTRSAVRSEHGPPDAFSILFYDEVVGDSGPLTVRAEQWTYYDEGLEYSFAGDELIARDPIEVPPDAFVEPAPYDPDAFEAYMGLDELLATTGLADYIGGPVKDLVQGGELYFADRLTWGMKDGELIYVEALALETDEQAAGSQP
jgi:hypothetical protein